MIEDVHTPGSDKRDIETDEKGMVEDFMEGLTPRERDIITQLFNLDGEGVRSGEEVRHQFGVTRERIRQIKEKALRKMRKKIGEHENPFRDTGRSTTANIMPPTRTTTPAPLFSVDELL